MNCEILKAQNIGFGYTENNFIFKNLNLAIKKGESIVLMGENGSGKTTLMKLLTGLLTPQYGRIFFYGEDLKNVLKDENKKKNFRRKVTFLLQNSDSLLFTSSVMEELKFTLKAFDIEKSDDEIINFARKLKIESFLDKNPFLLSEGQRKLVALASLLILEPEILLIDEIEAGFDPPVLNFIISEILKPSSIGLIISTHNLNLAYRISDRILFLKKGG